MTTLIGGGYLLTNVQSSRLLHVELTGRDALAGARRHDELGGRGEGRGPLVAVTLAAERRRGACRRVLREDGRHARQRGGEHERDVHLSDADADREHRVALAGAQLDL